MNREFDSYLARFIVFSGKTLYSLSTFFNYKCRNGKEKNLTECSPFILQPSAQSISVGAD